MSRYYNEYNDNNYSYSIKTLIGPIANSVKIFSNFH